jgi:hypothetical protein
MVFYLLYLYSVSGQGEYEAENIHRMEVSPSPVNLDVAPSEMDESFEYRPTENDDPEEPNKPSNGGDIWGQKEGNKIQLPNRE